MALVLLDWRQRSDLPSERIHPLTFLVELPLVEVKIRFHVSLEILAVLLEFRSSFCCQRGVYRQQQETH